MEAAVRHGFSRLMADVLNAVESGLYTPKTLFTTLGSDFTLMFVPYRSEHLVDVVLSEMRKHHQDD